MTDLKNPPICDHCGEPMWWRKHAHYKAGGYWACRIKAREANRRWRKANPEKMRESNARWNPNRLRVSGMYLGMCGFTDQERTAMLNGSSE